MREKSILLHREAIFDPEKSHAPAKTYGLLQPPASGQRGVSDWSVTGQSRVVLAFRSGNGFRLCIERCHPDPP